MLETQNPKTRSAEKQRSLDVGCYRLSRSTCGLAQPLLVALRVEQLVRPSSFCVLFVGGEGGACAAFGAFWGLLGAFWGPFWGLGS